MHAEWINYWKKKQLALEMRIYAFVNDNMLENSSKKVQNFTPTFISRISAT